MATGKQRIWYGDVGGLISALAGAERLDQRSATTLRGDVERASAYYSFASDPRHPWRSWEYFNKAKYFAKRAASLAAEEGYGALTHGQCDVLGTILLRQWLWRQSEPSLALQFFDEGLSKLGTPAHSRALLHMGRAEAYYVLGNQVKAREELAAALALQHEVERYKDEKGERGADFLTDNERTNHFQFIRVLRRAMVLAFRLGDKREAEQLYQQARSWALDPNCSNFVMAEKIDNLWKIYNLPMWRRWKLYLIPG